MIEVKDLTYHYRIDQPIQFPDFSYQQGQQALILGESGCGKTTLLHLLSGLLKPKKGFVSIDGKKLNGLSGAQLDKFRGANIGIVFQTPHFIEALSVKENLQFAQTLAGNKKDTEAIKSILSDLGIGHKLNDSVKSLSQGEKQRVTIARALVNQPKLILADEPTSALDDKNCRAVVKLLKEQAKKNNATLLIVTHDNRLNDEFEQKLKLS
ncbi:ABC transporter ATP-binding protein [Parvicella tangerina]|uniref:Lipoprotein-releasing system ATP-binding protein LolD n=1 Tax=Parvicella tangerina TaxID=2829795 RepID=A0A916JIU0_9FLAO|nr:ATP-binding cassette domain-containing protein [Parvicella tangerina]CAG5076764.1 Lipoprotein-releasing system ATP-binding protein LolD [Parvicella tangerina]